MSTISSGVGIAIGIGLNTDDGGGDAISQWILVTGLWRDIGTWIDSENWRDS